MKKSFIIIYYIPFQLCRTFTDPQPDRRLVLDAVSSLSREICSSLKLGVIRRCSFSVCIRRDVFNFLFSNCGSFVSHRPGKFYLRNDFCNDLFSDSDFMFKNKFDEVVCVLFPV